MASTQKSVSNIAVRLINHDMGGRERAELPDVNTQARKTLILREPLQRKEERIENAAARGRTAKIKY